MFEFNLGKTILNPLLANSSIPTDAFKKAKPVFCKIPPIEKFKFQTDFRDFEGEGILSIL